MSIAETASGGGEVYRVDVDDALISPDFDGCSGTIGEQECGYYAVRRSTDLQLHEIQAAYAQGKITIFHKGYVGEKRP